MFHTIYSLYIAPKHQRYAMTKICTRKSIVRICRGHRWSNLGPSTDLITIAKRNETSLPIKRRVCTWGWWASRKSLAHSVLRPRSALGAAGLCLVQPNSRRTFRTPISSSSSPAKARGLHRHGLVGGQPAIVVVAVVWYCPPPPVIALW